MTTTSLLYLLVGIAVGWGIEAILDYFFWHSRRNCSETERHLRTMVHDLERQNAVLDGRLKAADIQLIQGNGNRETGLQLTNRVEELKRDNADLDRRLRTAELQVIQATNGRSSLGLVEMIQALAANRGDITVNVNSEPESKSRSQPDNAENNDKTSGRKSASESTTTETKTTEASALTLRDNLTVIHNIGRKWEELLNKNGIMTFRQLAETSVEELDRIIEGDDENYLLNEEDYSKWKLLAALAADGNFQKFEEETLRYRQTLNARSKKNLEHILGIGKRLEEKLNEIGIKSLKDLENAEFDQTNEGLVYVLKRIKGSYGTEDLKQVFEWVKIQAGLAYNEYWGRLKGYKQLLKGNVQPEDLTQIEFIDEEIQAKLRDDFHIFTLEQLTEIDQDAVAALFPEYDEESIGKMITTFRSESEKQITTTSSTDVNETY